MKFLLVGIIVVSFYKYKSGSNKILCKRYQYTFIRRTSELLQNYRKYRTHGITELAWSRRMFVQEREHGSSVLVACTLHLSHSSEWCCYVVLGVSQYRSNLRATAGILVILIWLHDAQPPSP